MSPIGKLFVVLNLVFSIAILAVLANVLAKGEHYTTELSTAKGKITKLESDMKVETEKYNESLKQNQKDLEKANDEVNNLKLDRTRSPGSARPGASQQRPAARLGRQDPGLARATSPRTSRRISSARAADRGEHQAARREGRGGDQAAHRRGRGGAGAGRAGSGQARDLRPRAEEHGRHEQDR
jgi:hypothetical protein